MEKVRRCEQTAGPFDRLRAGSSTAPLAIRLRGPFDYAQGQDDNFYINRSLKLKLHVVYIPSVLSLKLAT